MSLGTFVGLPGTWWTRNGSVGVSAAGSEIGASAAPTRAFTRICRRVRVFGPKPTFDDGVLGFPGK